MVMYACEPSYVQVPEEGVRLAGARITSGCTAPDLDAGNWMLILYKGRL